MGSWLLRGLLGTGIGFPAMLASSWMAGIYHMVTQCVCTQVAGGRCDSSWGGEEGFVEEMLDLQGEMGTDGQQ